jgi:quercetin dioxygenase-like cupin family protein
VPLRGVAITQVAERLQAEPAFMTDGRNAQTIHDDGVGRVIVSVLAGGRDLGARRSEGHVGLLLTEGRGTLRRAGEALELSAGTMVIVAPDAEWSFEATESSVLVGTFWAFGDEASGWTER